MRKFAIRDTKPRNLHQEGKDFFLSFCINFTVLALLLSFLQILFPSYFPTFSPLSYVKIALICLGISFLQSVFFSTLYIKHLSYLRRVLAFGALLYVLLLALNVFILKFDILEVSAFATFTLGYLLILVFMSWLFTLTFRKESRDLNKKLERYRSHTCE